MQMLPQSLAIFGLPGGSEWIIILILGLLIFGRRMPEVGKSLGRSIVEFKKGLKGVQDEIDSAGEEDDQADMLPPPKKNAESETTSQAQEKETVS